MRWDATHGFLFYKQDRRGNVVFLMDGNGGVVEKYSYDAFGKPKLFDWWGNERAETLYGNRFLFTGRESSELGSREMDGKAERPSERARASQWIAELGIYDYRNRMYHPDTGRFLQTDPICFNAGDMNLFRYCGDDPVDRTDPTGLVDTSAIREYSTLTSWLGGDWIKGSDGLSALDWNDRNSIRPQAGMDGGGGGGASGAKSISAENEGKTNGGRLMPLPPDLLARMYATHLQNVEEASDKSNWTSIPGTNKRVQEEYSTTIYRRGGGLDQIGPKKGYHINGAPYSDIYGREWKGGIREAGTHIHVTGNRRHHGVDVDRARENRFISGVGHVSTPNILNIYVPPRSGQGPGAYYHTNDGVKLHPGEF